MIDLLKINWQLEKIDSIDYRAFPCFERKECSLTRSKKKYQRLLCDPRSINSDMLKYYSIFEHRMYRLNKYEAYHVLPLGNLS